MFLLLLCLIKISSGVLTPTESLILNEKDDAYTALKEIGGDNDEFDRVLKRAINMCTSLSNVEKLRVAMDLTNINFAALGKPTIPCKLDEDIKNCMKYVEGDTLNHFTDIYGSITYLCGLETLLMRTAGVEDNVDEVHNISQRLLDKVYQKCNPPSHVNSSNCTQQERMRLESYTDIHQELREYRNATVRVVSNLTNLAAEYVHSFNVTTRFKDTLREIEESRVYVSYFSWFTDSLLNTNSSLYHLYYFALLQGGLYLGQINILRKPLFIRQVIVFALECELPKALFGSSETAKLSIILLRLFFLCYTILVFVATISASRTHRLEIH